MERQVVSIGWWALLTSGSIASFNDSHAVLNLADFARLEVLIISVQGRLSRRLSRKLTQVGPSAGTMKCLHIQWGKLLTDLQAVLGFLAERGIKCTFRAHWLQGKKFSGICYPESTLVLNDATKTEGDHIGLCAHACPCGACVTCLRKYIDARSLELLNRSVSGVS